MNNNVWQIQVDKPAALGAPRDNPADPKGCKTQVSILNGN